MLKIIKQKVLSDDILMEIISIKSTAWPYTTDQHKNWIKSNLKDEDLHVLLYSNNEVMAYLNLVNIELKINDNLTQGFGIGNVCSLQKGKGVGSKLMTLVYEFLSSKNKVSLLFCKFSLVGFYKKHGWKLVNPDNVFLKEKISRDVCTMTLEPQSILVKTLEYKQGLF